MGWIARIYQQVTRFLTSRQTEKASNGLSFLLDEAEIAEQLAYGRD